LFWLSLVPFTTRWMDESGFVQIPVLTYGINLLGAAIAYFILEQALIRQQGRDGPLAQAIGRDWKGKTSPLIFLAGLGLTAVQPLLGVAAYTIVALIWLIPDRRVEHFVTRAHRDVPARDCLQSSAIARVNPRSRPSIMALAVADHGVGLLRCQMHVDDE